MRISDWSSDVCSSDLASVGCEMQFSRDNHADREAGSDGQRRRDIELPADDLLAGIVDRVLAAVADRLNQAVVVIGRKLRADAQQRREAGRLCEIPPMVVDAVLQARVALDVGARLALEPTSLNSSH